MRVTFDISQPLLELSELELTAPENVGTTLLVSSTLDERRKVLQRGLNLEDAAKSLLDYVREYGRQIRGDKASISSDTEISITLDEAQSTIDSVSALSGISTGSFNINGETIQIDTSTDSLYDVIDRINDAGAGVKASFNFDDGELTITSLREAPLFMENGSSNFLEGTYLKDGFIAGENGINMRDFLETDSVQQKFSRFTGRFNRLMAVNFEVARLTDFESNIQSLFRSGIQTHVDSGYESGAIRLSSDVQFFMNSDQTRFTKTTIGFNSADTPYSFFNFLESTSGILGALSSLSGNQSDALKENIRPTYNGGLIIDKKI